MSRKWSGRRARERMRTAGIERADQRHGIFAPLIRRATATATIPKADLRAAADLALATFTGTVTRLPMVVDLRCPCGHHAKAHVAHGRPRPSFRCSKCGTVVKGRWS
jgi:hypothetical protein